MFLPPLLLVVAVPGLSAHDEIADMHQPTHGDDLAGCGAGFRRQDADLAKDLARLSGNRAVAVHDQEITRLKLIVVAEVDLDEVALAETEIPVLRIDDESR